MITQRKPSCATTKLTLFTVSKDEWDTKEDTGKSMKNALYILRYTKRYQLFKHTLVSCNIFVLELAIEPGVLQTFSTCATCKANAKQ